MPSRQLHFVQIFPNVLGGILKGGILKGGILQRVCSCDSDGLGDGCICIWNKAGTVLAPVAVLLLIKAWEPLGSQQDLWRPVY